VLAQLFAPRGRANILFISGGNGCQRFSSMVLFRRINLVAVVLAFIVVVFGAFVRLSNAGLGCPDWPGCYGHLTVTQAVEDRGAAEAQFPQRPIEAPKAWKEMIHRYLAMVVACLVLVLTVLAWTDRGLRPFRGATLLLIGVILAQAELGRLTVLWKVNPLTVTGHLLLGLATLALLWWIWLRGNAPAAGDAPPPALRGLAALALTVVAAQIFLGGWTSSNYAALACPDFPMCQGHLLPQTSLAEAFTLWHGMGVDYEYGILDVAARATIHLVHRYGALLVSLVLGGIAAYLLARGRAGLWRRLGWALLGVLALQLAIGISIVKLSLPLWLADAHNAGAALLLLTVVALNFFAWRRPAQPPSRPAST
jgi:cytochrome c oxidase assembly protein subunit 15